MRTLQLFALVIFTACGVNLPQVGPATGPLDGDRPKGHASDGGPDPFDAGPNLDADDLASLLPRSRVEAPAADLTRAATGERAFSLDLYRKLAASNDDNVFLSPLSIDVALSMTYAGARGATAEAFEHVLKSGLLTDAHHRATNALDAQLTSRGNGTDPRAFTLKTANKIFCQAGFTLKQPFLDTLATEYGAGVRPEPFTTAPELARANINTWVAAKTDNHITELLAPGSVGPNTPMVLVNAITFYGAWEHPFSNYGVDDFVGLDGAHRHVAPMLLETTLQAATVNGTEIVRVPYVGGALSMLLLMPPAGHLHTFEATLDEQALSAFEAALAPERVLLTMPKFEMGTKQSLVSPLTSLGLGIAFGGADFSGFSDAQLSVADVIHHAYVKVDENGTEAAAATAVVLDGGASAPKPSRPVTLDRPFIVAVIDQATNTIVFIGRVTKP